MFGLGMRAACSAPRGLSLCRGAWTLTTEDVVPKTLLDDLIKRNGLLEASAERYDRVNAENTELMIEAALLRQSVMMLTRDKLAASEKSSLRGCIGE